MRKPPCVCIGVWLPFAHLVLEKVFELFARPGLPRTARKTICPHLISDIFHWFPERGENECVNVVGKKEAHEIEAFSPEKCKDIAEVTKRLRSGEVGLDLFRKAESSVEWRQDASSHMAEPTEKHRFGSGRVQFKMKHLVQVLLLSKCLRSSVSFRKVTCQAVKIALPQWLSTYFPEQLQMQPKVSNTTILRHQLTLCSAWLLYKREQVASLAASGAVRYFTAESSVQGGNCWLLSGQYAIPAARMA